MEAHIHHPDVAPAQPAPPLILRVFARCIATLTAATMAFSAAGVLVALALIGYSVASRYLFGVPVLWVDNAVSFVLVGIVMFGAASALRSGQHVSVDLLTGMLGERARRWAEAWAMSAVLAIGVFLVINGWETAMFSRMLGMVTQGYVEVPLFWLQLLVPFGGFMLALVSFDGLVRLACGQSAHVDQRDHTGK